MIVQTPLLEAGDKLDQKSFHARYQAMPPGTRAELIEGIVYMPSPMKTPHGKMQRRLSAWLDQYESATPGVEGGDGMTTILGDDSEPEPDCCLYILAEKGGQSRINEQDYLEGPPELIAEIASGTESIDLHAKKRDYEKRGVREYVVVALRQKKVFWFAIRDGKFVDKTNDADGILRSGVFPGLWLDPAALIRPGRDRIQTVIQQGVTSREHAEFVKRLTS